MTRLTERDKNIILWLSLCSFLSARQLTQAFFDTAKNCRRRLGILEKAGYTNAVSSPLHVGVGRAEKLYFLNKKKRDDILELLDSYPVPIEPFRQAAITSDFHHHSRISDFLINLAACEENGLIDELIVVPEHRNVRTKKRLTTDTDIIRPDARFTFSCNAKRYGYCLEIHTGTQGAPVIREKLEKYIHFAQSGQQLNIADEYFDAFRCLVVTDKEKDAQKLTLLTRELNSNNLFCVTSWEHINKPEDIIFRKIWQAASHKKMGSLYAKGPK